MLVVKPISEDFILTVKKRFTQTDDNSSPSRKNGKFKAGKHSQYFPPGRPANLDMVLVVGGGYKANPIKHQLIIIAENKFNSVNFF